MPAQALKDFHDNGTIPEVLPIAADKRGNRFLKDSLMKVLPQLLSCLLVASVALLNSGAAWSTVQTHEELSKSSAKTTHKKAKKARGKVKNASRKNKKSDANAIAASPVVSVKAPSVPAENPYLPASTASIVAKPNIYLPGAVVTVASAPNPYTPVAVPATSAAPLALTKSMALGTASVPVAPQAAPSPVPAPIASTPAATKAAVAPAPAPQATIQTTPWQTAPNTTRPNGLNPYLVFSAPYNQAPATFNPAESLGQLFGILKFALPSLPTPEQSYRVAFNQPSGIPISTQGLGQLFNDLRQFLPEPHLPSADIDILPSIKKVYPTGEKPLVVLTFKCPTELIGITPIPTKVLRWLITTGMDGINSTNLLSFNMQQVCQ